MSNAMELAQQYADTSATWHVENLYGTSKSYTEECRKDKAAIGVDLFTELRRLADIEHEHRALLATEQSLREELAALKASLGEPVGCLVETDQAIMVWPIRDYQDACTYCLENEQPTKLYALTNKDQS